MIDVPNISTHAISTLRRRHGADLRGEELDPQTNRPGGRFGYMFSRETCPPAEHNQTDLDALAQAMTAKQEDVVTPEEQFDDEENTGISAGYTYLGQFIDHDLTFDPVSSFGRQNDLNRLVNFRTPRFDLDCLYGRGPDEQPYLYAEDSIHMLLGRPLIGSAHDPGARDLPRNTPGGDEPRRALIGDPRNDENVIVAQLHATMLRFHNRMADLLIEEGGKSTFDEVRREVCFHYQWMVLHDFLPTIIGTNALLTIFPQLAINGAQNGAESLAPNLQFFTWEKQPFIPLEFSVAAYRFGHSMIRPLYRLNTRLYDRQQIFVQPNTSGAMRDDGLVGFDVFPQDWAIDWNLFFRIDASAPELGRDRVQPAYKIDSSLVNPLGNLPGAIADGPSMLAVRNLRRGLSRRLPSGQAVARAMGLEAIPDAQLRIGKATTEDNETNQLLTHVSSNFAGNAPLWYYILAEAQQAFVNNTTPIQLGPVGGRIVGEVFVGLLWGDSQSYLQQNPGWHPREDLMSCDGKFGMAELIHATRV